MKKPKPNLVGLQEIAERLGVNESHMRRLVAERRIPYVKWGKLLRFDPDEVDAWVADHTIEPFPSLRAQGTRRRRV